MTSKRSTARDGLENQIESFVLTHFRGFWEFAQSTPWLSRTINRALINRAISKTPCRPYPFSTLADYTSWDSLTDRTYSSRHLPSVNTPADLPAPEDVANLFMRRGATVLCPKSTVLFAYFAQWFTDGFLRTDPTDRQMRKNTSNHEIDLCPLYGIKKSITDIIRAHRGGLLKSQIIQGEEYPPYLCENGTPKAEFKDITEFDFESRSVEEKDQFFAMGGDRANVQIGYVMFNVLFLREHNRIAGLLAKEYPAWDDERLFQTARNIVLVILIRIVIEEYINHIAPYLFRFLLDPSAFPNEPWYRQNWMAVEFTLVYRWHMLIPTELTLAGKNVPVPQTMWNTSLITSRGLGALFEDASRQPAGKVGLFNSPAFFFAPPIQIEQRSIRMCRTLRLASYNDYREVCQFPRVTDFNEITGDPEVQSELRRLYGNVDKIDFYAGLFAEDVVPNSVLPPLIGRLVGIDAFSQALTNPLLNPHIYKEETFSPLGMQIIEQTHTIADVLHRNLPQGSPNFFVSLTRQDWTPS